MVIDRCCRDHDLCYESLSAGVCSRSLFGPYFIRYQWNPTGHRSIECREFHSRNTISRQLNALEHLFIENDVALQHVVIYIFYKNRKQWELQVGHMPLWPDGRRMPGPSRSLIQRFQQATLHLGLAHVNLFFPGYFLHIDRHEKKLQFTPTRSPGRQVAVPLKSNNRIYGHLILIFIRGK